MRKPLIGALVIVAVTSVATVLIDAIRDDDDAPAAVHRVAVRERPWQVAPALATRPSAAHEGWRDVAIPEDARGIPIMVDTGGFCRGEPRPTVEEIRVDETARSVTISALVRKVRDHRESELFFGHRSVGYGYVCSDVGTGEFAWATLRHPLGDRILRDAYRSQPLDRRRLTIQTRTQSVAELRRSLKRGRPLGKLRRVFRDR